MLLAGCYDLFDNESRFTIITTSANESMALIHERMPLLIAPEDAEEWLHGEDYTKILKRHMPPLNIKRDYVQLSIMDLLQ